MNINNRPFVISGRQYDISARYEAVISPNSDQPWFELLSTVRTNNSLIDVASFYNGLPAKSIHDIYDRFIQQAIISGHSKLLINLPYNLFFSDHILRLCDKYHTITLAFELPEVRGECLFEDISDRIDEVRQRANISFFLDDFGTQNSNFDFLESTHLDGVKLSKEVFWQLFDNHREFLVQLLKFLKRYGAVIVEGVDKPERFYFCKTMNVLMQGYYITAEWEQQYEAAYN
ncbi:EAL domain-containing protein [Idiomarina seosinensis]|uniref:EAL domain-containing protein n=1 Tax=Idiomarina seosinensis TaxID=281739 RepID=UPI0038517983